MTMPKTIFSTPLSGSAKETERRIRNIFQGRRKRPAFLLMLAAAVMILLCGSVVSFQTRPQMPELAMELQFYDVERGIYVEVPALSMPGGAEPTEGAQAIAQALAELSGDYRPLARLLSGQAVYGGENDDIYETQCFFYPCATERYLNLVFFRDRFHTDLNTGHVLTLVYDAQTGRQVTREDALALAGTSEAELFARLSAQIDPELDAIAAQYGWGSGALRVQDPVLEGWRIRADGTVVFYLTGRQDDAEPDVTDYVSGAEHLYIYQDGVFSRYDQYGADLPALVPSEETMHLETPLWCQWKFEGTGVPQGTQSLPIPDDPTVVDALREVLLGQRTFYSVDAAELDVTTLTRAVTPEESIHAEAARFAVVDLDGDGALEVILWLVREDGSSFALVILREQAGTVYGYAQFDRTLFALKTDGSYSFSGSASTGGVGRVQFVPEGDGTAPDTWVTVSIAARESLPGGEGYVCSLNGETVTEEEYDQAVWQQSQKPDAVWYDFTEENINVLLP